MTRVKITGGNKLSGTVTLHGAKNAALPILAATILFENQQITLENIPHLYDVKTMLAVLQALGIRSEFIDDTITLHTPTNAELLHDAPDSLVSQMRATLLVMGAMLAKKQKVTIALPGGCSIGYRPVDLHISALETMGATISLEHGVLIAEAPEGLRATNIHLDVPSVGATENIIMAATLTPGTTTIDNASKEPEVLDLIRFLNIAGANISGAGTSVITITGVDALKGVTYEIIPDRIEAATYMIAVASTGGEVTIENVIPGHLETFIAKLREIGVQVHVDKQHDTIRVVGNPPYVLNEDVDIRTSAYPGFNTDMQPLIFPLLMKVNKNSLVMDTVFSKRFHHAEELQKLGLQPILLDNTLIVQPQQTIASGKVTATDIRDAATLILVGISQPITLEVEQIDLLYRGYENLIENLNKLGANIETKE